MTDHFQVLVRFPISTVKRKKSYFLYGLGCHRGGFFCTSGQMVQQKNQKGYIFSLYELKRNKLSVLNSTFVNIL